MSRIALALAALAAVVAGPPASAAESQRNGAFEFRYNRYRPDIDSEFHGAAKPYEDAFGTGNGGFFRLEISRSVFKTYGTFDVGIGSGYFQDLGYGRLEDGSASSDRTAFHIIPVTLSATYRLDVLPSGFVMPLMPYARFSLERYHWWTTGAARSSTSTANGFKGSGATNGFSASAGVALLLDFIDRGLAREMDNDTGINHTYLFFDVTKSWVDDFGSSKSFNLSNAGSVMLGGGLMFIY